MVTVSFLILCNIIQYNKLDKVKKTIETVYG